MEHDSEPTTSRLGRYELVESLGRGGMGLVFRARAYAAAGVTKDVCVKRIRPERLGDDRAVQRFIAEAQLSMGLAHANIVPVFDFGRADDGYFLAMEWVDGADLRSILGDGPLPAVGAAYVGAAVARALAYAHDPHGPATVHRDVKPANILVSLAGDVKLADFGVAAVLGSGRGMAGTEGYMAPEQRDGAEPSGAADLFSLGVVLRELLEQVPDELAPLLASLGAEDPSERPRNADEVAEALEAFVASERVRGAPSPREVLRARARRARREGAPVRDVLGAELSFLRDGRDHTFHSRMDPSAPTQPAKPRPASSRPRRRWGGLAVAALALALTFALGQRWRADATEGVVASGRPASPASAVRRPTAPNTSATPVGGRPARLAAELSGEPPAPPAEATEDVPERPAPDRASRRTAAAKAPAPRRRLRRPRPPADTAPIASADPIAAPDGTLEVNATPWALVFVDGRRVGETPLLGLRVPAGPHTLRLVNEPLGARREVRVEVRPGEPTRVLVDLDAAPAAAPPAAPPG